MPEQKDKDTFIQKSSGNVFEDLDVRLEIRDVLKNAIAREICAMIDERGLTQAQAAQILGTDQAKVSNITRGRLSGFSVDRLVNYLAAVGYDIDIHLNKSDAEFGTVKVHAPLAVAAG